MQKKILFLGLFLQFPKAFALYNGAPNLPELPEENFFLPKDSAFSLKANYEGDLVLGRKITATNLSHPIIRSLFNGGEIAFGIIDRLEIYSVFGAFEGTVFGSKHDVNCKLKMGSGFGGDIGVRAIGIFWRDIKVGFDAKYFYGWPNLESVSLGSETAKASAETSQREWQVGVAISQKFAFFTPYVGVNYSGFNLEFINIESSLVHGKVKIKNTSPFGFVVGMALADRKIAFLDFEGRFFNEYAFSWTAGFRF